ncbi:MAG: amino acid ABC transporter permease [Gaiellaceae bacterium]
MNLPDWARPVIDYSFHEGLPNMIRIAIIATVASTLIGMVLGTLITIDFLPTRLLIRFYIEVWRGLPLIVTIFMVYFWLPKLPGHIEFDAVTAGSIGLTLWGSAQIAEATRGAVQSIPYTQHQAAAALGFGWLGRNAFVIVPQSIRRLLPPLTGLLVGIIQNTTLAGVIGASELLSTAERSRERLNAFPPAGIGENHALEIFGGVALVFFVISFPLILLGRWLEKRFV